MDWEPIQMILRVETRRHGVDEMRDELRVRLSRLPPPGWRRCFESDAHRSWGEPWLQGDWAAIRVARGKAGWGLSILAQRISFANCVYERLSEGLSMDGFANTQ